MRCLSTALAAALLVLLAFSTAAPAQTAAGTLYFGPARFENCGSADVSFTLSADEREVSLVVVSLTDLTVRTESFGSATTREISEMRTTSHVRADVVDGRADYPLGDNGRLLISGIGADEVRGQLDYSVVAEPGKPPVSLGSSEVVFQKVGGPAG
ncbi:MAG: hypothetical protein LBO05_00780 [Deltaproteobacteria bacterium]|jgi:hypothetical protein|nr:hypothetical protein [Deltaproteobacteria bacterium]